MWGPLATANTYRFSSKEIEARTGDYDYGYRYYAPNLQRWLNQDPLGEAGGINLYDYVGNNPINEIDPLGLSQADAQHIGQVGQQSIDTMTQHGERSDGWTGGWINNGLADFTKRRGCVSQANQVAGDLQKDGKNHKYDDFWSYNTPHRDFPPHTWVEATSSNPNDPKVIIDPWRNTITQQYPFLAGPLPYSGGPVNAPVHIN
jgi:RHS repeat-associated protein